LTFFDAKLVGSYRLRGCAKEECHMKIITGFIVFMGIVCMTTSGFAQSQKKKPVLPESGNPVASTVKKENAAKPNNPDDEVQGRVVYLNKITREMVVVGEDNVKRPVKLSPLQFDRMKIGETVNVSGNTVNFLSRGSSPSGGLRISRRYVGSRIIERWD
jgi:hypothetical protein